jgi:hypothetical protein
MGMREIWNACAYVALAASSAGCSFITLSGAQGSLAERSDRVQCGAWILAPMTDAAIGGLLGLVGLAMSSLDAREAASGQFAVCGASTEPVRIALAVDADGRVVRTHVYPPVDAARAQCVATVAKTIAFPPSAVGLIFAHELAW